MKRDRETQDATPMSFFQARPIMPELEGVEGNQKKQTNDVNKNLANMQGSLSDFPEYIRHFLGLNCSYLSAPISPEYIGNHPTCVIDTRRLDYQIQFGWGPGRLPFVCLKLNNNFNQNEVITLYPNREYSWKYCSSDTKSIVSLFDFEDNNSPLGNFLINPNVPCHDKVRALENRLVIRQEASLYK